MDYLEESKWTVKSFYLVLFSTAAFILGLLLSTDQTYDKADGLWHFMLARYSVENPMFLLDLWGKPLFTVLASGFAQFGFKGVHVFQLICFVVSSFSAYKIAEKIELSFKLLIPILIAFTPVYLPMILSSLTEILFGTIIIAGIALLTYGRYTAATILISFSPYSRQEGFMILLIFLFVCILHKKYWHSALLITGTTVLSIVGGIVHQDFLWLIHQHPYSNSDMYGHGEWFHYIKFQDEIFGTLNSLLVAFGLLVGIVFTLKNIKKIFLPSEENRLITIKVYLVLLIPVLYFVIHSFLWYKGMSGSLGLYRIMACIVPLNALLALIGLTFVGTYLKKLQSASAVLSGILALGLVYATLAKESVPLKMFAEEEVIYEAGKWCKANNLTERHYFFSHPFVITLFDFNPYASTEKRIINYGGSMSDLIKPGDLVFWDAHFGPNECALKLEVLKDTAAYKEVKHFLPVVPFKVLGDHDFEVYIFEKK